MPCAAAVYDLIGQGGPWFLTPELEKGEPVNPVLTAGPGAPPERREAGLSLFFVRPVVARSSTLLLPSPGSLGTRQSEAKSDTDLTTAPGGPILSSRSRTKKSSLSGHFYEGGLGLQL